MLFAPACMLQAVFQSFFVTAGRPGLGLLLMTGAGILNMILDYVLIVPCQMGIAGAALATGIGQCIPAVFGLFFFAFSRKGLRFCKFTFSMTEILDACYNGSSEMVSQLSNAVITFLFNIVMMSLAGEHGVAPLPSFYTDSFYSMLFIWDSPLESVLLLVSSMVPETGRSCGKFIEFLSCSSLFHPLRLLRQPFSSHRPS